MNRAITRRTALKRLTQGGVGLVLLRNALSARAYAANEKLNLAQVGAGGRGKELVGGFARMENLVALCDVNQSKAAEIGRDYDRPVVIRDIRAFYRARGRKKSDLSLRPDSHFKPIVAVECIYEFGDEPRRVVGRHQFVQCRWQ
jgi:hypothetical protein